MNIIEFEKPEGVIASLGGQTAINLAQPLDERGVKIIGTDCDAIDRAEDRDAFEKLLNELNIPRAKGKAVTKHGRRHCAPPRRSAIPCWCAPPSSWAVGPCRSLPTSGSCATT